MVVDHPATGNIHYLYRDNNEKKREPNVKKKKREPIHITKEIGISLEIFEKEKNPGQ